MLVFRKWTNRHGGVNRLIAILMGLIALLGLIIAAPVVVAYREHAEEIACALAQNKAQSMMRIELLFNDYRLDVQEAAAVVDRTRYQRDTLCPSGGDYFIVRQDSGETPYKVVCGLHDKDAQERTRICSGLALSRLLEELEALRKEGKPSPKRVNIVLNGKKLTCRRVEQNPGLLFGTDTDIDHNGIVCYYALMGDEEYRAALEASEKADFSGLREGEVWYFAYADPHYASVWSYANKGNKWIGDAWETE